MHVTWSNAMRVVSFDSPYTYCKIPSIATDDDEIIDIILKYLIYFYPTVSEMVTYQPVQYHAVRYESRYLILKDNVCIANCACLIDFLDYIKCFIEKLAIDASPNDAQLFHGSAVIKNGVCLCLIAPSGFGKSSLAFGLCQRGWEYISDDILILCHDVIQPIPLPIELRRGIDIDDFFLSNLFSRNIGEKDIFVLPATHEKINKIIFVVLSKSNSSSALHQITAGESYISLLDNLKVPCESTKLLKKLLLTAKKYTTYILSNREIYESLALLDELKNE